MLIAKNIQKSFHSDGTTTNVLKGVSVDIAQGEFVSLVGRSGSGKSTMMNILSTLMRPDSGELLYKGTDLGTASDSVINRIRQDEFSVIFQFHHLFPYLTALENVMLPYLGSLKPVTREQRDRAFESLARVGLKGFEKRLPGQLSGGEQQRVAIARALVKDPALLFADEPTGSLDKNTGNGIIELLQKLNAEGLTILMVTHALEYSRVAHTVIEMEDGKVAKVGEKVSLAQ